MKRDTTEKNVIIGSKVPRIIADKIAQEAARRGVSRSVVVRWALVHYLESAEVKAAV